MTMTLEEAIQIAARHALAIAADSIREGWDSYPEVGENDWERVVDAAIVLAPWPPVGEFVRAYKLLSERAESLA